MKNKNDFINIMASSLIVAGMSTLVINAIEESSISNAKNIEINYSSEVNKNVNKPKIKTVSYTNEPIVKDTQKNNIKVKKDNKSNESKSSSSSKSNSKSYKIFDDFSKEDRFILYRIVEAEAGDGNIQAKKNVAHVIFNRLNSKKFPNNIHDIVFAKHQFSPISDGRYWKVKIAESTKQAVIQAYEEGDTTGGALYFANMKYVYNSKTKAWFNSMNCLFTDSINHSFYK